jgi:hypothetical protein
VHDVSPDTVISDQESDSCSRRSLKAHRLRLTELRYGGGRKQKHGSDFGCQVRSLTSGMERANGWPLKATSLAGDSRKTNCSFLFPASYSRKFIPDFGCRSRETCCGTVDLLSYPGDATSRVLRACSRYTVPKTRDDATSRFDSIYGGRVPTMINRTPAMNLCGFISSSSSLPARLHRVR